MSAAAVALVGLVIVLVPIRTVRPWISVLVYTCLIGGLFLNQPYLEPFYQLIAAAIPIDDAAQRLPADAMRRATTSLTADFAGLLQRG